MGKQKKGREYFSIVGEVDASQKMSVERERGGNSNKKQEAFK